MTHGSFLNLLIASKTAVPGCIKLPQFNCICLFASTAAKTALEADQQTVWCDGVFESEKEVLCVMFNVCTPHYE